MPHSTPRALGAAVAPLLLAALPVALLVGCGPAPEDAADGAPSSTGPAAAVDDGPPVLDVLDGFGYQPRACGFDLDDDGVVGEPEDCRVCDGATADPDGDGVDEDLVYVDCGGGADADGCGSPESPCASMGFAFTQLDGADDGAEDIVCFKGTCREEAPLVPTTAGVDGTYEVAATGHQERAFERGKDPAMVVGWDADGDGEYPPFDADDTSVLDGGAGATRTFLFGPRNDRFELAHFQVDAYGISGGAAESKDSGFIEFGPDQGELEHVYLHDLYLTDINKAKETSSEISTLDLFTGKTRLRHLWLDNIWAPRNGGWFARGAAADQGPDNGPYRFQNLTVTARGCDFDTCENRAAFVGFHLWGYVSGIEILDGHFDAGVDDWQPKPKGGPAGARFALVAQCSQDWTIRHNRIADFKNALRIQGWADRYCDNESARPVDGVVFERNQVHNAYAPWTSGDMAIQISEGGDDPGEEVGDVLIAHNELASPVGWEACVWIHGGSDAAPPAGALRVVHNTCVADIDYHGAVVIGDTAGRLPAHPHANVEVTGNIFTGLGNDDLNLRLTYEPANLRLDHNRYDPAGGFLALDEKIADFAAWQESIGVDAASKACLPSFEDFENGRYQLDAED
ncbi:MAG: hypothetical protein AAGF23_07285, partial [Acidobacteriota bacterium]